MPGPTPVDRVLRYHAGSTHHPNRFAPGPGGLDWANQPDPFRTWAGARRVELPLAGEGLRATWDDIHRPGAVASEPLGRGSLGAFLELTLGLTAWKEVGASRWSLRANPSSGNLHPTEGYVVLPEVEGLGAGLHHYLSRDHLVEHRWRPAPEDAEALARLLSGGVFLLGLSSIHWREAWKYGARAFRYCQHDAGHALATARYAAAALGWAARVLDAPGDEDVAAVLGLDREEDVSGLEPPDRERPDALVLVAPPAEVDEGVRRVERALDHLVALVRRGTWTGRPNGLSPSHVEWEEIHVVAAATRKPRTPALGVSGHRAFGDEVPFRSKGEGVRAVSLIRRRRSAVDMDGRTALGLDQMTTMLDRLVPRPAVPPWDVLPWRPRVQPVLLVHRVRGLPAGLYVLERDADAHEALRLRMRPTFVWEQQEGGDASPRLFLLEEGDTRSMARFVSCHQAIASDSAFSLGMLARFEESLDEGPWWYRRLFWECGVLGQVLYMEAEAAGLRGTGIGCYFDDVVHEVLGLEDARFRDLYHFTVGGPVEDPRLATRPAYPEDVHARTRQGDQ